jgi:SnoaL-like protein
VGTVSKDTVAAYAAAWNEPDVQARRALLERSWAADGVYCDPTARVEGREALVGHIGGFHAQRPGHRIEMASGVDEHDGLLRFAWRMVGPDGSGVLEGMDFGELAGDGRLKLIVGFFGPFPALGEEP